MNKIECFIFDMDGLMFDTGHLAYRAYLKSAEKHDYEVNHNVYYYLTGRTEDDIREEMAELYGTDVPSDVWRDTMNRCKEEILMEEKRVHKKPGLVEILKFAKEKQIKVALASSNKREKIDYYLEIEGIADYIDIIIAGDEVTKGKPDPEIFLTACKKAEVAPNQAVVFEDSEAGIEAAGRAGIFSILIEDDISDLPIREGQHPLLKDLSKIRDQPAPADFQFQDLLEAKDFLDRKELYL